MAFGFSAGLNPPIAIGYLLARAVTFGRPELGPETARCVHAVVHRDSAQLHAGDMSIRPA